MQRLPATFSQGFSTVKDLLGPLTGRPRRRRQRFPAAEMGAGASGRPGKVSLRVRPGRPAPCWSPSAPATHHDSAPRPGTTRSSQREPPPQNVRADRCAPANAAARSSSAAQHGRSAVKRVGNCRASCCERGQAKG